MCIRDSYYFMGKDNITFHTVIWPGILLGANGQGSLGGTPSEVLGTLDLPTEIVSSESVSYTHLDVYKRQSPTGSTRG